MDYLSTHFTLTEALHSQAASRLGLSNDPPLELFANIKTTAYAMERVRTLLDSKPILISSWYRSPEVNTAVGGSKSSAHTMGWAVDFTAPTFGSVGQIIDRIRASGLDYDQLINEFNGSWCHISIDPKNRKQALVIDKDGTRFA